MKTHDPQYSKPEDIDREFWADKSMTRKQKKDVRSFAKFADEKMNTK